MLDVHRIGCSTVLDVLDVRCWYASMLYVHSIRCSTVLDVLDVRCWYVSMLYVHRIGCSTVIRWVRSPLDFFFLSFSIRFYRKKSK